MYRDHKDFLVDLLWSLQEEDLSPESIEWGMIVFSEVLEYVHEQMPYDYTFGAAIPQERSMYLTEFGKNKLKALCRHQGLLTQVLLQALGIHSRIYRCDFFNVDTGVGGRHVANIAKLEKDWYLGDATSPETSAGSLKENTPFIRRILSDMDDVPAEMRFFRLDAVAGEGVIGQVKYITVPHMYYRIRDNKKDQLG